MEWGVFLSTLLAVSLTPLVLGDGDVTDEEVLSHDCQDYRVKGKYEDKIYNIYPGGKRAVAVCEGMADNSPEDTAWTIIQRRRLDNVDFKRNWADYKIGFGSRDGDHWIGNDVLNRLTMGGDRKYVLRIEIESWDTPAARWYADYSEFVIGSEDDNFRLMYNNYTGDAGDSMRYHKDMNFTTPDRDNDIWPEGNCAHMLDAGWWFGECGAANLNGQFYRGQFDPSGSKPYRGGIWWFGIGDMFYSFKSVMKIRPMSDDYVPQGVIA